MEPVVERLAPDGVGLRLLVRDHILPELALERRHREFGPLRGRRQSLGHPGEPGRGLVGELARDAAHHGSELERLLDEDRGGALERLSRPLEHLLGPVQPVERRLRPLGRGPIGVGAERLEGAGEGTEPGRRIPPLRRLLLEPVDRGPEQVEERRAVDLLAVIFEVHQLDRARQRLEPRQLELHRLPIEPREAAVVVQRPRTRRDRRIEGPPEVLPGVEELGEVGHRESAIGYPLSAVVVLRWSLDDPNDLAAIDR